MGALPVSIQIQPDNKFDFDQVTFGESSKLSCVLVNQSSVLPLDLKFKKVAQFNIVPKQAHIKPNSQKEFSIVFQPNQPGGFKKLQMIELFGRVFEDSKQPEHLPE